MGTSEGLSIFARVIVNQLCLYNEHSQLSVRASFAPEELRHLMEELDEYYGSRNIGAGWVEARFDSQGNGSLYLIGRWRAKDHILGHTDQLLLSWEAI